MNKKNKNGVDLPKKASSTKKPTKKDLELIISSLEDKQLRLKAEFDNFRKRKESEISSLLKYEGKSFILDFLSVLDNLSRGIDSYKQEEVKKRDKFKKVDKDKPAIKLNVKDQLSSAVNAYKRREAAFSQESEHKFEAPTEFIKKDIEVPSSIQVGELAKLMAVKGNVVVKNLKGTNKLQKTNVNIVAIICLLFLNFLTLNIAMKDIKNCIIAKSRSFPISNEIKRINIVDDIRATVVSNRTVNNIENIAIGIMYAGN